MERVLVGKKEAENCQSIKNVNILLLCGLVLRRDGVKMMQFNKTPEFAGCAKINDATKRLDQTKIKIFNANKE